MFGFIISYLLIVGLAKSIDNAFKAYHAALIYSVTMTLIGFMFSTNPRVSAVLLTGLIRFMAAWFIFALLDRYSDTVVTWLLIFGVGATVLLLV